MASALDKMTAHDTNRSNFMMIRLFRCLKRGRFAARFLSISKTDRSSVFRQLRSSLETFPLGDLTVAQHIIVCNARRVEFLAKIAVGIGPAPAAWRSNSDFGLASY
jgi:hypothetical protein